MSISFSGLSSGIDTSSWVESLVALRQAKVTKLEEEKESVVSIQDVLSNIKSFFTSFRSTIEKVTDAKFGIVSMDLFAQNLATSSNINVLTGTATTEAEEATYNIQVDKLASSTEAASNQNFTTTVIETATATLGTKLSDIGVKNTDGTPGVWTGITKNDAYFDGSYRNLPYMYQTAEGEPLASFYLIKTDGIFQSDAEAAAYVNKDGKRIQPDAVAGDLKFVDANGDGVINDEDRQYCGSATPKTTFSFSGGFTWKKLSVSAMFQGVGGAQALYVGKYMALSDVEGNFNRSKEIMNAWSPSNTGSNIPRLSKNDPNSNFSTPSDWYLENASYLRLKNFTVSYDLSDVIRKCAHLQERNSMMSVYLSGENLFTITNYSGMDPETGGWDALKYPVSRVFSVGVKLTY